MVQGDSQRLPFASNTFDVVTSSHSFHHYPHQDQAVAEMHRVLRPGGRLMIIDGYRDAPWGWFIFDVCVAGVEGSVHHASARTFFGVDARCHFVEEAQRQKSLQIALNLRLAERVAWPCLDVIKNVFLTQSSPANDLYILDCALLGRLLSVGGGGRQV